MNRFFNSLRNAFQIEELRERILFTALMLLVVAPLLAVAGVQPAASEPPAAAAAATNGMIATFAWKPGAHISDALDLVVMKADGSGAQILVPGAARRSLSCHCRAEELQREGRSSALHGGFKSPPHHRRESASS